jgi:hypothetical protein
MNKARNLLMILTIILFLSLFITLISQGQQKSEWLGTIENEDGIKVIKNPAEPLYGEIEFELEEDLSIGDEEDENYVFNSIYDIAVDSEENIFALDGGDCKIQKFDKDGNHLQTIGRKGQGPGEFEQSIKIHLDSEDMIYVYDSMWRKILIFEKDGRFKKNISPPSRAHYFGITEDKNILMLYTPRSYEDMRSEIILIDTDGEILKNIASYPYQRASKIKGHILGNPYTHRLYFYPTNDGGGIYGHSSQYKFFILDSIGNLSHKIEMDILPKPITKKDKENLIERYLKSREQFPIGKKLSKSEVRRAYIFPEFKPFFRGLGIDDLDRIYVGSFELYSPRNKIWRFDIFSKEGYYLYKTSISKFPKVIMNGHIYTIERDPETDYSLVKRYKIKNWDKIKAGT